MTEGAINIVGNCDIYEVVLEAIGHPQPFSLHYLSGGVIYDDRYHRIK